MKNRTTLGRKINSLKVKRGNRKQPVSPLRIDPTRTVTLRRVFLSRIRKAFNTFKYKVLNIIGKQNYLGLITDDTGTQSTQLSPVSQLPVSSTSTVKVITVPFLSINAAYKFGSSADKLRNFQWWMRAQLEHDIVGQTERQAWQSYVEEGFRKGAGRAFDDTKALQPKGRGKGAAKGKGKGKQQKISLSKPSPLVPPPTTQTPIPGNFTTQTREEFLRSAFGNPVAIEKVQLLAARTFDELDGISSDMSTRMSRVLTDGMVQGKGPHEVARDLADEIDISRGRAERIARTEIIRAHAEGQLQSLEMLGVTQVGAKVEWATAGDSLVCPKCDSLNGKILSIKKARGVLPLHPNCRCCWMPAFTEDEDFTGENVNDSKPKPKRKSRKKDDKQEQESTTQENYIDTSELFDLGSFDIDIGETESVTTDTPVDTEPVKPRAKAKVSKPRTSPKPRRIVSNKVDESIPEDWVNRLLNFLPGK